MNGWEAIYRTGRMTDEIVVRVLGGAGCVGGRGSGRLNGQFGKWTARQDSSVIFKPSDKCKGLVVMPKESYIHKAQSIIADYEHIPKNPTPKLEAQTKSHPRCDG